MEFTHYERHDTFSTGTAHRLTLDKNGNYWYETASVFARDNGNDFQYTNRQLITPQYARDLYRAFGEGQYEH